MTTKKLQQFFEDSSFNVNLVKDGKIQCAELETWTGGGVNMIIYLNPFNVDSFKEYVNDFCIDDEIDLHRQDKHYRNDFTIRQSVEDFESYLNDIKEVAEKLDKAETDFYNKTAKGKSNNSLTNTIKN
jgi:hypothetical protein